jgi:ABC-2 type transport system ATP-binding protein
LQNLEIRVRAYGRSVADPRVRGILNEVGLADRADDRVGDFSLGMRQRMGLALALVGEPSIVVLDEPTNGLDPEGTVEIRNLIRGLPERDATALVCTHRLAEVEATCDYVVVLDRGRLLAQGPLAEVVASAPSGGEVVGVAPEETPQAADVLERLGLGPVTTDGGLLRTAQPAPDPAVISRALAEQGIYVRELRTERAGLEDAFLKIVAAAQEEQ